MQIKLKGFTFTPSDDPEVEDDCYVMDGRPDINIQVCTAYGEGYSVNLYGYEVANDPSSFYMRSWDCTTLESAAALANKIAAGEIDEDLPG